MLLVQVLHEKEPVPVRQHHILDQQVGHLPAKRLPLLLQGTKAFHLIAGEHQVLFHALPDHVVVLDDIDQRFILSHLCLSPPEGPIPLPVNR